SVFFRVGWGLERNRNGTDGVRSVLSLRAALGRFDAPGAGLTISTSAGFRMDFGPGERRDLRTKATRTINMSEMGRALEETSDPPIRALYVYNCNPTATAPNQGRVVRALAREDLFTVVHEQVWTDTCALADVVLPATTFLEHKEMCRQYGGYSLQWGEPVIAPRGEARSNHAVFAELARAMRFDGDAFAASEEDIARATLGATRAASVDLERLRAERFVPMPSVRPFVDVFPSRGHVDLSAPPGPPNYRPAPVDAHLPLSLISPASDKAITSTLFELVPAGSATVAMSPSDAAARGLRAGDRARVWNSIGEVVLRVAVSDEIPAGVASIPKGLWRRATENGWTANALAPDHVDELGGGACYNDARVDVAPA
ncbi:MAG TPA: molybdopterin-dependent oxidoreductase, partial [Planctomycetota bacterium]|nr:molybdopterin-dependent oxidoreductase [Planctomycetota bacterium]